MIEFVKKGMDYQFRMEINHEYGVIISLCNQRGDISAMVMFLSPRFHCEHECELRINHKCDIKSKNEECSNGYYEMEPDCSMNLIGEDNMFESAAKLKQMLMDKKDTDGNVFDFNEQFHSILSLPWKVGEFIID